MLDISYITPLSPRSWIFIDNLSLSLCPPTAGILPAGVPALRPPSNHHHPLLQCHSQDGPGNCDQETTPHSAGGLLYRGSVHYLLGAVQPIHIRHVCLHTCRLCAQGAAACCVRCVSYCGLRPLLPEPCSLHAVSLLQTTSLVAVVLSDGGGEGRAGGRRGEDCGTQFIPRHP